MCNPTGPDSPMTELNFFVQVTAWIAVLSQSIEASTTNQQWGLLRIIFCDHRHHQFTLCIISLPYASSVCHRHHQFTLCIISLPYASSVCYIYIISLLQLCPTGHGCDEAPHRHQHQSAAVCFVCTLDESFLNQSIHVSLHLVLACIQTIPALMHARTAQPWRHVSAGIAPILARARAVNP